HRPRGSIGDDAPVIRSDRLKASKNRAGGHRMRHAPDRDNRSTNIASSASTPRSPAPARAVGPPPKFKAPAQNFVICVSAPTRREPAIAARNGGSRAVAVAADYDAA